MANGFSGMDACYISNKYCEARCLCDNNYYGKDCSLDLSTLNAKIALRDSLCENIVTLTSQQNPTADNIRSLSTQMSGIFVDITQISDTSLATCTRTYVDFLREDLNVAAQDAQFDEVMDAISSMLALGPRYTKEYVDELLLLISIWYS